MITSLNNFSGIQKEVDIALITLEDNTVHSYCSEVSWQHDNSTPIGTAKVKMPYSPQIEKYWVKYYGAVVIHANLNNKPQMTENEHATISQMPKHIVKKEEEDKITIQNNEYNYSFIGKVSRFKQEGNKFILFLEDLGWKFLQKVPNEFRKTYIAGQTLDNAFQAICEFMGVEFAYSIEELSKYNFAADGYSIEKDGTIIEDVPSIFEGIQESDEEDEEKTEDQKMADSLSDATFESSGLIEYEHNQAKNQASTQLTNQLINNDQSTIEENNPKIEQYQEEFDKKIEDLFKGNTFYNSNISDAILNYNSISITPTAQNMTTVNTMQTNMSQTDTNQNNINQTDEEANNEGVQTNNSTDS